MKRMLAIAVSVFFVLSLAGVVIAEESMVTLKGDVVAVDKYSKTLTVKSIESAKSSGFGMKGQFTFDMDKMTNVTTCNLNKSLEDINVGEKVTVTYHLENGRFLADAVDIAPTFLACYDQ